MATKRKQRAKKAPAKRSDLVAMRVTPAEKALLERIHERTGISPSKLLRSLLEPVLRAVGPFEEMETKKEGGSGAGKEEK